MSCSLLDRYLFRCFALSGAPGLPKQPLRQGATAQICPNLTPMYPSNSTLSSDPTLDSDTVGIRVFPTSSWTYGAKSGDNGDSATASSTWLETMIYSINNTNLSSIYTDNDGN